MVLDFLQPRNLTVAEQVGGVLEKGFWLLDGTPGPDV